MTILSIKLRLEPETQQFVLPDGMSAPVIGGVVIVSTARGQEHGVVSGVRETEQLKKPLPAVLRLATREDLQIIESLAPMEARALQICETEAKALDLKMKLIDACYNLDNSRITIRFMSDGYIDFRELVRRLGGALRSRIELRQIGQRDEFKTLGGLGMCGRPFCCKTFLRGAEKVSIKMAKDQNLSLNPAKISGACGRLMCCIKYEANVYGELQKISPKNGARVQTPDGPGVVVDGNLLTGSFKVRMDDIPDAIPKTFGLADISGFDKAADKPKLSDAELFALASEGGGAIAPEEKKHKGFGDRRRQERGNSGAQNAAPQQEQKKDGAKKRRPFWKNRRKGGGEGQG